MKRYILLLALASIAACNSTPKHEKLAQKYIDHINAGALVDAKAMQCFTNGAVFWAEEQNLTLGDWTSEDFLGYSAMATTVNDLNGKLTVWETENFSNYWVLAKQKMEEFGIPPADEGAELSTESHCIAVI